MRGTNALTGRPLTGDDHLRQSIADVLMTPLGSRVMRRDYGSLLPELLDQPWGGVTLLRLYAAAAMALMRWEPRIGVRKVTVTADTQTPGAFVMDIEGDRVDELGRTSLARFTLPLRTRPLQGAAYVTP